MPNARRKFNIDADLLQQFMVVTGTDETTAKHFLEACGGDLNAAVSMHMDSLTSPGQSRMPAAANGGTKRKRGEPSDDNDSDSVRAPIPQKTEVLAPNGILHRHQGKRRRPPSVFDQFRDFQAETMRPEDQTRGRRTIQELFRPPIELLHKGSFQSACQAASTANRWLIATIHEATEFQCQVLNRDVWSNEAVQELVRQQFILWQAYSDSEGGRRYMHLYHVVDWPYVAIIDPRTGEKMMAWQKVEVTAFCDSIKDFLALHPAPSVSDLDLRPAKKARTEASIVDASEEKQLTAALAASIRENSYESTAISTSDDEHTYNSDSDLETFSGSEDGTRPASRASGRNSQNRPRSGLDNAVISAPRTDDARTDAKCSTASATNGNGAEVTGGAEQWKNFRGNDNDPMTTIIFRGPNNFRNQLSLPNSSTVMALVSYVSSHGFPQNQYEIVMPYPRKYLCRNDLNVTLRDLGFNTRETLHIQEISN